MKNALLLAVKNMPWTILISAITILFIYVQTLSLVFVFYMLFMGAGTYAYITAFIYNRIFEPYLPKERAIEDDRFLSGDNEKTTKKLVVTGDDNNNTGDDNNNAGDENNNAGDETADTDSSKSNSTNIDNNSDADTADDIKDNDAAPAPKKRLSIADKVNSVTAYEQANEEK